MYMQEPYCTCLASTCWFPLPEPHTMQPYIWFHNVHAIPANHSYRITGLEMVLKVLQNDMHVFTCFCVSRKFRDVKYANVSLQLIGSYSVLSSVILQHGRSLLSGLNSNSHVEERRYCTSCMSGWCRIFAGILKLNITPVKILYTPELFNFNRFSSLASVMAPPPQSSVGRMVFWPRQSWSQEKEAYWYQSSPDL